MTNESLTNHPMLTIYRLLKRLYIQEMSAIMDEYDLTRLELDVLLFLDCNPDKNTAAEIVSMRNLTKSHVSSAVDHLTQMGLITQAHDPRNRRRIHLHLTDATEPILRAGRTAQDNFVRTLSQGLSDEEQEQFVHILRIVGENARTALGCSEE